MKSKPSGVKESASAKRGKSTGTKDVDVTTTVVSWGMREQNVKLEGDVFPPGLFRVKAIADSPVGIVILNDDGTLVTWSMEFRGPGGRTRFLKHLETLRDVVKIKASRIGRHAFLKTGVYVWKNDGTCQFHCFDNENKSFQTVELGGDIVDVICTGEGRFDVGVLNDGTLKEISILKTGVDDEGKFLFIQQFVSQINSRIAANKKAFRDGYKCGGINAYWKSYIWADKKGILHNVSKGDKYLAKPPNIQGVAGIACDGTMLLQDGKLIGYDPFEDELVALPDYGGYGSIKEPIISLKGIDRCNAIGISASGRAFLVSSESIDSKDRYAYTKKNISPPEWRVLDAIFDGGCFVGIINVPASQEKLFRASNTSCPKGEEGMLVVSGENINISSEEKEEMLAKMGPVRDAVIFWGGWICLKNDGSLCGYNGDEVMDLNPPWFPRDIISLSGGAKGGIVATRADGRTLHWSCCDTGKSVTWEELKTHPELAMPDEAGNAIKILQYSFLRSDWLAIAIVRSGTAFQKFISLYEGPNGKKKDQLYYSVTRGHALLDQAVNFKCDQVGILIVRPNPTGIVLGWRLCMAWEAFEIWMQGLLSLKGEQMSGPFLEKWSRGLPSFAGIDPPGAGKTACDWIEDAGGDAVLNFLGVSRGDRDILTSWLSKGCAIKDWPSMVLLANALRNATAHGVLLVSKAQDLGLQAAMKIIPSLLQEFATGCLRLYMDKAGSRSCRVSSVTKGG